MDLFTLTIQMGNDAMQTRRDIARALHALAEQLASPYVGDTSGGGIMDLNGNRVGRWALEPNAFEVVNESRRCEHCHNKPARKLACGWRCYACVP